MCTENVAIKLNYCVEYLLQAALRGSRKALVIDKCKACNLTGVQSNCLKVCPFPGD